MGEFFYAKIPSNRPFMAIFKENCYNFKHMTKEEKNALKVDRRKIIEENRIFHRRIDELFAKKYRTSIRFENALVMDDGKAYINVDLTKIESPFSEFSYNRRMNPEIYDYINNEAFFLRVSIPLVIRFDDDGKYSQEMKDNIRKTVVRHYNLEYEDCRLAYRKNLLSGFLILGIGAIFLLTYILLSIFGNWNSVIMEPLLIISWVCVWESINRFFFSGHERKVDVYNAGQLALAEVSFGKPVRKDVQLANKETK